MLCAQFYRRWNESRWLAQAAVVAGIVLFGLTRPSAPLWAAQEPDEEEQFLSQDRDTPAPAPQPNQTNQANQANQNRRDAQPAARPNVAEQDLDQRSGGLGVALAQEGNAVRIIGVKHDSPAHQAGLQVGDKLTAIDTVNFNNTDDVIDQISSRSPNTKVRLQVDRQGTTRAFDVTLTTRAAIMEEERPLFGQNTNMPQGQFFPGQAFGGYQSFSQDQSFVTQGANPNQCLEARVNELWREVLALREEVKILRGTPVDNRNTAQAAQAPAPNSQQ